jgi:hypothetical protein
MLAERPEQSDLSEFLASLPCRIMLPEGALTRRGDDRSFPPNFNDRRRFARRCVFDSLSRAALEYRQTLPAAPREPGWHAVYVVDVSRGGMRLFHFEPLYPQESFRVVLASGVQREVVVARCRRICERCYSIGVGFNTGPASDETSG